MARSLSTLLVIVCSTLGISVTWSAKILSPREFLDYYVHGATLGYFVNYTRCTNAIYRNITEYSFGNTINNGYVTSQKDGKFLFTYSSDREVDGKHLNLSGPAIRSTFISLDESPIVIVDMNDLDPSNWKVMDQSEQYCRNKGTTEGGFVLYAQTSKGTEVSSLEEVRTRLLRGDVLHYVFDIYHCSPPLNTTMKQYYAGKIFGKSFITYSSAVA